MVQAIFVPMIGLPPYRKLPLAFTYQVVGIVLLILIGWAQRGFQLHVSHWLFLLTNYGTWMLVLPWLAGWVTNARGKHHKSFPTLTLQFMLILTIHWFGSNLLFYLFRPSVWSGPLLPTVSEILEFLLPSIGSRIIDMALFIGVLAWIQRGQDLARQQLEINQKELDLHRNKLQTLRDQLNPHFLFNTLHNISSMIGQDDEKAQQLTIHISQLLRKILAINKLDQHTFREEWDFTSDYLKIESERFHDRLKLEIDLDEDLMDIQVPTLILQPLIENAFKHGVSHMINSTVLRISGQLQKDQLTLKVINDLPENPSKSASGVGIPNLSERLAVIYGGKASLETMVLEGHFVSKLILPVYH